MMREAGSGRSGNRAGAGSSFRGSAGLSRATALADRLRKRAGCGTGEYGSLGSPVLESRWFLRSDTRDPCCRGHSAFHRGCLESRTALVAVGKSAVGASSRRPLVEPGTPAGAPGAMPQACILTS